MIELLQPHTVDLYRLSEKQYYTEKVCARTLLTFDRFDLFAKLTYIQLRSSNPDLAKNIYADHIKAFNPDLKEPGRDDKNGLNDFINTFDDLIDYFKENEFNDQISVVPVSEHGVILDGSHRIAALAFYDKEVTILKFDGVRPLARFDYQYFLKRGLSIKIADQIAFYGGHYADNIYVACLWPKMGEPENRRYALNRIEKQYPVLYVKNMRMTLQNLSKFIAEIYRAQDWVGTPKNNFKGAQNKAIMCHDSNRIVQFVLFKADSLDDVLKLKDQIRNYYKLGKHVVHITDDQRETQEICELILTDRSREFSSEFDKFSDKLDEYKLLFKNVYLLRVKEKAAKFLKTLNLYRK